MKLEDALGSLLRGRQLVVMSDTKQLPTTSFFDLIVETDNEDEEEVAHLIEHKSLILNVRDCPANCVSIRTGDSFYLQIIYIGVHI